MSEIIGAPSRARRPLRHGVTAVVLLTAALTLPGRAFGGVDLTGDWLYEDDFTSGTREMQVVQNGGALSVTLSGSAMTGTIDSATGAFQVSTGFGDECGGSGLSGTATPDGNAMSGIAGFEAVGPPPFFDCVPVTFSFTAERILCGNGVLDPGETCDDGNRLGFFDCCSATCQLLAAGTACRPAGSGLCDVADTCDGVTPACPNQVAPAGTPCRAPADACDVGEVCSGTSAFCPPVGPPDADGDGVGDLCDPCPGSDRNAVLVKPRLRLARYDGVAGNDALSLQAKLPLSSAAAAFLNPVATGMAIAIGTGHDAGGMTVTLPPGAHDPTTGQGWTPAASGRKWSFRSADPLLPVTKAVVKLVLGKSGPHAVVKAIGKRRTFAAVLPPVPLALGLALDPPIATSVSCGGTSFSNAGGPPPACTVRARETALSCR